MSPAALILQPPSVARGASLGIESLFVNGNTCSASPLVWFGNIKIGTGQKVAMLAVTLGAADRSDRWLSIKKSMWQKLFAENLFGGFTRANASDNRCPWNASLGGPLSGRQSLAGKLNSDIVSLIVALRFRIRPLAVFRAIGAIVINALNTAALWRQSHIKEKVLKLLPMATNVNPAPSIIFIGFGAWVGAPSQNTGPNSVSSGAAHSMFYGGHWLPFIVENKNAI